jgi:hypothetical protein
MVRYTPDGMVWATTKGFLGVGHSESEAVEKLALLVAAAERVIPDKPDTASRPVSAHAQLPAAS